MVPRVNISVAHTEEDAMPERTGQRGGTAPIASAPDVSPS